MTNGSPIASLTLSLSCNQIPATSIVTVDYIQGQESISTPYYFEVTFSTIQSLSGISLIGQKIQIQITPGTDSVVVNGVILAVFADNPTMTGHFVYRLGVVPHVKLLDLNKRNQVFGTQGAIDIKQLIQQLLGGDLDQQATSTLANPSQPKITPDMRVNHDYPTLDFIVQYGESDLAFLSRRCEDVGIFYFFEQSASASSETIVFADQNTAFPVCSPATLEYSSNAAIGLISNYVCVSFCEASRATPAKVYLNDYNYQHPDHSLLTDATVAKDGFGNFVQYGQNYATQNQGSHLAKVRAEEIACRSTVFTGISTAPYLRPGYVFSLVDHPDKTMNTKYIVTQVSHSAGAPVGFGQDSGAPTQNYQNTFTAIPFSTSFRPQRITPKPVAAGLFNAKIDSSGDGQRADLDSTGRYKLRLFYDESNAPAGSASNFIRKADPYAGKNDSGMDLPLLKGTEVVLGFVNGDPDRPIIVGAPPNPQTPDVVTSNNSTRNRIKTTSAVLFEIEDGPAPQQGAQPNNFARLSVPGAATSYLRLGVQAPDCPDAQNSADAAAPTKNAASPPWGTGLTPTKTTEPLAGTLSSSVTNDGSSTSATSTDLAQSAYNQKPNTNPVGTASNYVNGVVIGTQQNLITNVGNAALTLVGAGMTTQVTTNDHTTTVSAGAFNVTAQQGVNMTGGDANNPSNIVLEAYGYVRTKSLGNSYVWSNSDSYTLIDGNKYQNVQGTNSSITNGLNQSTVYGRDESYKYGGRLALAFGAGISIFGSVDMKIFLGGDISFGIFNLKMVTGADMKFVLGADFKMVTYDYKIVTLGKFEIADVKNEASGLQVSSWGIISKKAPVEQKATAAEVKMKELEASVANIQSFLTDIYGIA